jgi:hypothetical protein
MKKLPGWGVFWLMKLMFESLNLSSN